LVGGAKRFLQQSFGPPAILSLVGGRLFESIGPIKNLAKTAASIKFPYTIGRLGRTRSQCLFTYPPIIIKIPPLKAQG
jgi:hypothetical protein